jgi:hypothetical protein
MHRLLLCSLALLLAAVTANAQVIPRLSGDIYDGNGGPLFNGTYHASSIRVPAGKKLTIGGVNLKFEPGTTFQVYGELDLAQGCYMTSVHDDLIGGDTNGNGGATIPQPGDWNGVIIHTSSPRATINSTVVRYAGRSTAAIDIRGTTSQQPQISLTNTQIVDSRRMGVDLDYAQLVTNNLQFYQCGGVAMRGYAWLLDGVRNSTAQLCAGGNYIERWGQENAWPASATTFALDPRTTLNNSGVFVFVSDIDVPATGKLTVPAGSIIKMSPGLRYVGNGDLDVQGTAQAPVHFTSLLDDSVGGDTNGDGNATSPAAGDWGAFMPSTSGKSIRMTHTHLRYGGGSYQGTLRFSNTNVSLDHCTIRDGKGYGIQFYSPNQTQHTITNCRFENIPDEIFRNIPLDSLGNCLGNEHGPGTQRQIIADSRCLVNTRLTRDNIPEGIVHLAGELGSNAGTTLTIHAGLIFKFLQSRYATGSLNNLRLLGTAIAPITLTTVHDDSAGGDTNRNGNATTPKPGDWAGLRFLRSTASHAEYVHIRYAGRGFQCQSAQGSARSLTIQRCTRGAWITGLTGHADNFVIANCTDDGLELGTGSYEVRHASIAGNGGYGIEVLSGSSYAGAIRNSIVWNNTLGASNRLNTSLVSYTCGIVSNGTGNIVTDPFFADPNTLTLSTGSPCIDAGQLGTGVQVARDVWERPRVSDWSMTGQLFPDMGAYELLGMLLQHNWALPSVGDVLEFRVQPVQSQNAGVAIYMLGFQDLEFLLPQGMVNVGLLTLQIWGIVPTGAKAVLPIPQDKNFVGLELAIQAVGVPAANPAFGNTTNLYRARLLR